MTVQRLIQEILDLGNPDVRREFLEAFDRLLSYSEMVYEADTRTLRREERKHELYRACRDRLAGPAGGGAGVNEAGAGG